ncbi:MAG TPA: glycosyltransferase [Candidatus Bathyarchaeia archaeon]|nr:glycosyltransferase [Candidatus Bathyarchaeia archaeon]
MRILHVTPTFPPKLWGGMTSVSFNLAKALAKRGHAVTVFTTDFREKKARRVSGGSLDGLDGLSVQYFMNLSNRLANERLYVPIRMASALKANLPSFDIVHLHDFRSFLSLAVHHYASEYGVPYVLQAHGSVDTFFDKGPVKRMFDRVWGHDIVLEACKLIATAPLEAAQYESMGATQDRIAVIPNGIDTSEFSRLPQRNEFRRKLGIPDEWKVILFVGRIHRTKGLDLLIDAFGRLPGGLDRVGLVIAGPDDGYLSTVRKMVEHRGLSTNVWLVAGVYGREKLAAYASADLFVLPSRYEIFGLVAIEAITCGVTTVVTDACGVAPLFLTQGLGYVARHDSADDLARILSQALRNLEEGKLKSERRRRYVLENLSWDRIVASVERVYEECVTGKRGFSIPKSP